MTATDESAARRLRVAILGGGRLSAVGRAHVSALRMDGRFEICAAMFSRDPAENIVSASAYFLDQRVVSQSFDDLLTRSDFDFVVVLTPTPDHFSQLHALLSEGQNCIVEKPMSTSSQEATELESIGSRSGGGVYTTYNYNAYPAVRALQKLIASGYLGQVHYVRAQMHQQTFQMSQGGSVPLPQSWRRVDTQIPMVSLDLGTHVFHLIRFLLQADWSSVLGISEHRGAVLDVHDLVSGIAKFSQVSVNFSYGKVMLGSRNGLAVEVFGDQGAARWEQERPEILRLSDACGVVELADRSSPLLREVIDERFERFKAGHPSGFVESLANTYLEIADLVENPGSKDSPVVTASDEISCLRFFEELHQVSDKKATNNRRA